MDGWMGKWMKEWIIATIHSFFFSLRSTWIIWLQRVYPICINDYPSHFDETMVQMVPRIFHYLHFMNKWGENRKRIALLTQVKFTKSRRYHLVSLTVRRRYVEREDSQELWLYSVSIWNWPLNQTHFSSGINSKRPVILLIYFTLLTLLATQSLHEKYTLLSRVISKRHEQLMPKCK